MNSHLSHTFTSPYFASIDLGSNSFHMLIAKVNNGMLETVDKVKQTLQIARGLRQNKHLSMDAQARALGCLTCFRERLQDIPPEQIRAVGTKALRSANNAATFIREAEYVLGHPIEIISGYEEARLIHLGVSHKLGIEKSNNPLIIDIGGGSTELIIGQRQQARFIESLDIGCVTYSDTYFSDDNGTTNATISKKMIAEAYYATCSEIRFITHLYRQQGWDIAVGCSGTIRAIAKLMPKNMATKMITREGLNNLLDELKQHGELKQCGELSKLKGISKNRARVLPAGIIILSAIFDQLKLDKINVVKATLKEGLIYDILGWTPACNMENKTTAQYQKSKEQGIKIASS